MSTPIIANCGFCGREFRTTAYRVSVGGGRFCCRACTDQAKARAARSPERIAERFWPLVERSGPILRVELGPCWTWLGLRKENGYGRFTIGNEHYFAHRVAWFLAHGQWPPDCVLHRCDGGEIGCVRLDHLFAGDHATNMADKVAKGRQTRGESHSTAKLRARDVIAIRSALAAGTPPRAIAQHFRVSTSTIHDIRSGKSWSHLQAP
jgi:hypothetical protein